MTDTQNEQDKQRGPFEAWWNREVISSVTGEIDRPLWGDIDKESSLVIWQAALSHAAQAKWQPIETAPKDCNVLLYYPLRGAIRGTWIDEEYAKNPKPYWRHDHAYIFGTGEARTNQPTHWMPLPGAPKKTAK